MGNQHYGALIILQSQAQGMPHFQIQVIGGLIQQQQVRLFQQKASQQRSGALSAAEVRQWLVQFAPLEINPAQGIKDLGRLCFCCQER